MKKIILVLSIALAIMPVLIISCNKSKETQVTVETAVPAMSDYEKTIAISNDEDWKTIVSNNLPIISKLVNSKIDISKIDLSKKENLLSITGLTSEKYDALIIANRAAAERLIKRYNLLSNGQARCLTCTLQPEQSIARTKQQISYFEKNSAEFRKFSNFLQSGLQPVEKSVASGGEGPGCPLAYYVCVASCIASQDPTGVCMVLCYVYFCMPVNTLV